MNVPRVVDAFPGLFTVARLAAVRTL
jgi:hypothetical protein